MKISLNWLADYVSWQDTPAQLADKLTAVGLNVESITEFSISFPKVVVGTVVHREQHPDADRLSLCRVDDGSGEPVQVVCGAPNVREGITVLFAQVGAVLPGNFKIKKSKIRGVESFGMICSGAELELSNDSDGIIELTTELPVGSPADDIYGYQDTVLDIEVTPNRPDWLSHVGVAREVAAIYGTKMSLPAHWNAKPNGESIGLRVKIEDYADCHRFMAFKVENAVRRPSPDWMQHRLRAIGSRPIDNIVDITNYVMFELGQPMHAYDRAKLSGDTITIKRSEAGLKVTTLDQQEHDLKPGTLLICDEAGPVGLAGVMGLAKSEVSSETTEIILESGFFDPMLVRQASRDLGLISEASYRFERGADWDMVLFAAHRALHLFQSLAEATIFPGWVDRCDPDYQGPADIPLRIWQVNRLMGAEITTGQAAEYLQALGLKVQPMSSPGTDTANAVNMMVKVPSFRRDLHLEVDLIEEIMRSHGLANLSSGAGFRGSTGGVRRERDVTLNAARMWFAANGYNEIVTSSFMRENDLENLGLPAEDIRHQTITLLNPHHGGHAEMRTVMLPSLLDVVCRNLNAGARTPLRLFQINRTYLPGGEKRTSAKHEDENLLPEEPLFLQFSVAGLRQLGPGGVPQDLLEIKGTIEALAAFLRIPLSLEIADVESWLQTGAQWQILTEGEKVVGTAGHVAPAIAAAFEVEEPVAVVEINLNALDLRPRPRKFEMFARFPGVKRDLSLVVPEAVSYGQIHSTVVATGGPLLDRVELFDIYRGQGIPDGTAAYGIRLKFRSAKGNLKGKAVDKAIASILKGLDEGWGITSRA